MEGIIKCLICKILGRATRPTFYKLPMLSKSVYILNEHLLNVSVCVCISCTSLVLTSRALVSGHSRGSWATKSIVGWARVNPQRRCQGLFCGICVYYGYLQWNKLGPTPGPLCRWLWHLKHSKNTTVLFFFFSHLSLSPLSQSPFSILSFPDAPLLPLATQQHCLAWSSRPQALSFLPSLPPCHTSHFFSVSYLIISSLKDWATFNYIFIIAYRIEISYRDIAQNRG